MTDKLQLIYFSPTNTTRRIVEQVAAGLKIDTVETCDLTHRPDGINA
jgi:flavodoxin